MTPRDSMTPRDALIISLIYFGNCDGEMHPEDILQIGAAARGDADAVKNAIALARQRDMATVMKDFRGLLGPAQKRAVVIRMLDAAVSAGGQPNRNQWMFLKSFCGIVGIPAKELDELLEVITLKNDLDVFLDPDHPLNAGK